MTETFTFDDILIKPKSYSTIDSRGMVSTETTLYQNTKLLMPILSASMSLFDTISPDNRDISYSFATSMHHAGLMHIFSRATIFSQRVKAVKALDVLGINSGISVSLKEFEAYQDELRSLPSKSIVSIDIANGSIIKNINWNSDELPMLVVGNFGNPGAVLRRDLLGKIAFKLGIGSGTGCTTRVSTGVGAPQAWLISETRHLSRKPIISDGGIKNTSDFVKAIALGADLVMIGRLFAATKETPWEPVKYNGNWYKKYRGMASYEEKRVRSHIEGTSGYLLYEEKSIQDVVGELRDGLTSAMSYCDSHNIDEFQQKAEFLKITQSVAIENGTRLYHF